jgi:hypothetical protein
MGLVYPHPVGNAERYTDITLPKYSDIQTVVRESIKQFAPYLVLRSIPKCCLYPYQNACNNQDDWLYDSCRPGFNRQSGNNGMVKNYTDMDLLHKKKATQCAQCRFNDQCVGVWDKYVDLYKDEMDLFPVNRQG